MRKKFLLMDSEKRKKVSSCLLQFLPFGYTRTIFQLFGAPCKDENQGFYDEYKTKGIFQFGKFTLKSSDNKKNKITFPNRTRNLIVARKINGHQQKELVKLSTFVYLGCHFLGKK